jgi:hypothetical protein
MSSCPCCCSPFTDRLRRPVTCAYCEYAACASCVQAYLLSSASDAKCMQCAAGWNREFLDGQLTRAFVHGPYKAHRETVLLEREKALLPDSQLLLENYKIARELESNAETNERELRALRRRAVELQRDIAHDRARANRITADRYRSAGWMGAGEAAAERRTFVRACPVDGCRGFLSSAHKCGTCEVWCCAACLEPKGADREAPHECDPDVAASARLIARDSRPCPGCASLIYKIDGCDQMWCVVCRTAFSWRTGHVVTTTVHNPHYYEWIRARGGEVPRAPGDGPAAVGNGECGLPGAWDLDQTIRRFVDEPRRRFVIEFHRVVRHIQDIELRRLRAAYDADDNTDLRLQYLLQSIDDTEFKRKLQQREKRRERDLAVRQIFEMYIAAATDAFNEMLAGRSLSPRRDAQRVRVGIAIAAQIHNLVVLTKYVNDQVAAVQRRFNMTVSGWNPVWARSLLRNAAEAAGFDDMCEV